MYVDVMEGADVGMVECACGTGFTLQTRQRRRMPRQIMGQELHSHRAVQFEVLGFIHIAHSATAQELNNPETSREDFTW